MFCKIILTVFAFVVATNCNQVLKITKCKPEDAACIKQNGIENAAVFAAGIPELNIEPLDPAFFKTIDASSPNLKLVLNDLHVKGIKDCTIKQLERNLAKSSFIANLLCNLHLEANYEMKGNLLLLAIEGSGKARASIKKLDVKGEANIEETVGKDGKKHWKFGTWSHSFELKDKSHIHFDNLFNGNEILSKAAKDLIENNSNDVIYEIGSPLVQSVISKLLANVGKYFKAVPIEDLELQ